MTRLILLATIALLWLAAPADAGFRINRSMEGVELGMNRAQVRDVKGSPADRDLGPDFVSWTYLDPRMEVTFMPDVITLFTRSRRIRGRGDIGVGSTERRLKRVLDGRVRCSWEETDRGCLVGSFDDGRRYTLFALTGGRVDSVTIGVSTP